MQPQKFRQPFYRLGGRPEEVALGYDPTGRVRFANIRHFVRWNSKVFHETPNSPLLTPMSLHAFNTVLMIIIWIYHNNQKEFCKIIRKFVEKIRFISYHNSRKKVQVRNVTRTSKKASTPGYFSRRKPRDVFKDMTGGMIVALVSIPIAMGYAQIAGLPMQYGLYGSVLPIFLFGLMTTSKDFVFGVDAAPAALVGTALASLGIPAESPKAIQVVPLFAFLVACWLLLFYLFKAGRMVQYISEPVMGGFVTGICCTIIFMQIPKLFGGTAGVGEIAELTRHLIGQFSVFNIWALLLGLLTISIILIFRRFLPRIPMSVILMIAGMILTLLCPVTDYGIRLLPAVESGFPLPKLPAATGEIELIPDLLFHSLSVAAVIVAESLLASKSNAAKDGYRLQPNQEILSYCLANFSASLYGCCPVNGSVSRTGLLRQFGVTSQRFSVYAAIGMLLVLFLVAPLIAYLPVPILTAIVISALIGACEFGMARQLWKTSRQEFLIFAGAFLGVLVFGTVYGVMFGVALSFFAVIIRAVNPPRGFLGIISSKEGFYPLDINRKSRPIKGAVIYRFGGDLFFANTETMIHDLERAIGQDTVCVIVHAGAIGSLDMTAAQELLLLYRKLKSRNIRFYLTEHIGEINDSLRKYGSDEMIRNGAVRMTIPLALRDAGIRTPYETDALRQELLVERRTRLSSKKNTPVSERKELQEELAWALGDSTEEYKISLTEELYQSLKKDGELSIDTIDRLQSLSRWGRLNFFDEDELLDRIETRLLNRAVRHPDQAERIETVLEQRRRIIEDRMKDMEPAAADRIRQKRLQRAEELLKTDPDTFRQVYEKRQKHLKALSESNPPLAEKYREVYQEIILLAQEKLPIADKQPEAGN